MSGFAVGQWSATASSIFRKTLGRVHLAFTARMGRVQFALFGTGSRGRVECG